MPDFKPDGFQLAAQLMIPEPQHFNPLLREEFISLLVLRPLLREAVPTAIKLNGEFRDRTVEIEVVNAAGILPPKSEISEPPVTEQAPQALFGVG